MALWASLVDQGLQPAHEVLKAARPISERVHADRNQTCSLDLWHTRLVISRSLQNGLQCFPGSTRNAVRVAIFCFFVERRGDLRELPPQSLYVTEEPGFELLYGQPIEDLKSPAGIRRSLGMEPCSRCSFLEIVLDCVAVFTVFIY